MLDGRCVNSLHFGDGKSKRGNARRMGGGGRGLHDTRTMHDTKQCATCGNGRPAQPMLIQMFLLKRMLHDGRRVVSRHVLLRVNRLFVCLSLSVLLSLCVFAFV